MIFRLSLLLLFLIPSFVGAQNIEDDPEARKIFEEVDQRRNKINSEQADMRMVIFDSRGNTRERDLLSFSMNDGEISKSLLIFESPANVRGTAFLSISEGSEEVQKLYLPALGQIQIISAAEKGDRFMGSDFTYEDLGDQDPEDYEFELRSKSDSTYVLRAEKTESSEYNYLNFYIDPERYVLQKIEYFNDDGQMIKRLEASGYSEVLDEVWQPGKMIMYDLRNDRKTELSWSDRNVNASIPGWRFTERGLRRGL
ncbi:outer membrane lipoprotein-sorting protein [Balneolaceae bacterium YR4-1]|uniref:Outer membrane lipoprotein-sorting protein n=1 Tax=Halalkalibaculum roseum TaxID=2709311 RepID=A0A6M1SUD3_9BACT|nr:outer membrane lipoprotein-sorting protein [Halalkalibaculum roseum]NGP75738.1 outer membrane lipoprotein-sorting protein [Halalkalibaculum roseum]